MRDSSSRAREIRRAVEEKDVAAFESRPLARERATSETRTRCGRGATVRSSTKRRLCGGWGAFSTRLGTNRPTDAFPQAARGYLDVNLCEKREWEDLVAVITDEKVLEATTRWLETAESLLDGTFARSLRTRVVLSAHAIARHGDVVLGGTRARDVEPPEEEVALSEASSELVGALEGLARAAAEDRVESDDIFRLERAWHGMEYHFHVWKVKDAASLERELVRIGVAMESSMLSVCGSDALDANVDLGEERNAIREAQARDRTLLRERLFTLSGQRAVDEFDVMIDRVRRDKESKQAPPSSPPNENLERRRRARETKSAETHGAISRDKTQFGDASRESETNAAEKDRILHELMLDPEWRVELEKRAVDTPRDAVAKVVTRAFWDVTYESLTSDPMDTSCVRALVEEWKETIKGELSSLPLGTLDERRVESIQNELHNIDGADLETCVAHVDRNLADACEALRSALALGYSILKTLAESVRHASDVRLDVEYGKLLDGLTLDGGRERVLKSVVDSLEFLFTFQEIVIKHVHLDVVNLTIDGLRQLLSTSVSHGAEHALGRFLERSGLQPGEETNIARVSLAAPRTMAWIESVSSELHAMDAELTPLLRSVEREWTGMRLQSGLKAPKNHATSDSSARVVVKQSLDPVGVCTVDGVVRIAFSRLVSSPTARVQNFFPEVLALDEERIQMMFDLFHEAHILSACVVLSKEIFAGDVDVAFVSVLVDRVSRSFQEENRAKELAKVAAVIRESKLAHTERIETITNMLAKLTANDNQMSLTIVNCLRRALTVRLLHGFESAAVSRRIERHLSSVGGSALRPVIDQIARKAAPVLNLAVIVYGQNILRTIVADVLSRDDEI